MPMLHPDSISIARDFFWQRGSTRAIRSGEWKAIWNDETGDTLLYHIADDPNEIHDLFRQKKDLAANLARLHSEWSKGLQKPLWPSVVHFREKVDGRWVYFDN